MYAAQRTAIASSFSELWMKLQLISYIISQYVVDVKRT